MTPTIDQLNPLIHELQALPDWPLTELPAGLLLYDVLIALGATDPEIEETLGRETLALIESPLGQDAVRTPAPEVC